MKGLKDLAALEHAPALEEFRLVGGSNFDPAHLLPVLRNPSLRHASAGFGCDKKNDEFFRLMSLHVRAGAGSPGPFEYR